MILTFLKRLWIVAFLGAQVAASADLRFESFPGPKPFTFDELERLATDDPPSGMLAPHLEDYFVPGCRKVQIDSLLREIEDTPNDVVVAGDLNTTGRDGTPVSLQREILKRVTNWRFWGKEALFWFLPVPFAGLIDVPVNYFKNYHDPTAMGQFDLAGKPRLAVKHKGRILSDTNQRAWKGFVPTFSFNKTYWHLVGGYKLDWFFAKCVPSQSDPAWPQSGRSLRHVNTALGHRISDHVPSTVDLPLN